MSCGFTASAVASAPIWPLSWETPYAAGVALKEKKKKKLSVGNFENNFFVLKYLYSGVPFVVQQVKNLASFQEDSVSKSSSQ